MSRKFYTFDAGSINTRKISRTIRGYLGYALLLLLISSIMTVLLYLLLSVFFSTDVEKRLKKENAAYEKQYTLLKSRNELISESISGLRQKDNGIYHGVFDSEAPSVDPSSSPELFFSKDSLPGEDLIEYTSRKASELMGKASSVNASFLKIYRTLACRADSLPPMEMPVKDISYPQIGAGTGKHYNPFYRAEVEHRGLDIIASQGTPVIAVADGVVSNVERSMKGNGNFVEIDHGNGYVTRYLHLSDVDVDKGQRIARGSRIGSVGMTGISFATHLHYEVLKDGNPVNPVDHFFAAIGQDEYFNMLYMSANTRQSMD